MTRAPLARIIGLLASLWLALLPPSGPAPAKTIRGEFATEPQASTDPNRHALDHRVREISGLAATGDGRIFGHDDERAVIYELDPTDGRLIKAFSFGRPVATDDFEGIAIAGDTFYLVSSSGVIYAGSEGEDGDQLPARRFRTGVPTGCEVEGLAYEPDGHGLRLVCKNPSKRDGAPVIAILWWSIEEESLLPAKRIFVPVEVLSAALTSKSFHPSGIERHPETWHYYLISARDHGLAQVSKKGKVLAAAPLAASAHEQPEGVTFSRELDLLIADEGVKSRAYLTRYPR